jgi:hypothetical protein
MFMRFLQAATSAPAEGAAAPVDGAAAVTAAPDATADMAQNIAKAEEAAEAASGAQALNAYHMFMEADPVVKFVMIVLILGAIVALSLLFEKVLLFTKVQKQIKEFNAQFRRAQSPEEAAELVKKLPKSAMKEMFDAGMAELARTRDMGLYTLRDARDHTLERVRSAMTIKHGHDDDVPWLDRFERAVHRSVRHGLRDHELVHRYREHQHHLAGRRCAWYR